MRLKTVLVVFFAALFFLSALLGIRFSIQNKIFDSGLLSFLGQGKGAEKPDKKNETASSLETVLERCYKELEIPETHRKKQLFLEDSTLELRLSVPRGKPMEWVVWFISSSLKEIGYTLDDCYFVSEQRGCKINLSPQKAPLPSLRIQVNRSNEFFKETAKMAILVEDFGFEADETTVGFLSFPEPLTVSLVSTQKMSLWTAQIANEYRKEIVILLPMEPLPTSYNKYASSMLMVHYPEEKIRSMLAKMMESVPYFAGFSNLHGDRVLEDTRVMKIFFSEIQKRHSYFLMTPGQRRSVAETLARKMEIPFEQIHFSINTNLGASAIQDTLLHCAFIAQKTGRMLIKGKASPSFILALNRAIPQFRQNGIQLVYASEIVMHPGKK